MTKCLELEYGKSKNPIAKPYTFYDGKVLVNNRSLSICSRRDKNLNEDHQCEHFAFVEINGSDLYVQHSKRTSGDMEHGYITSLKELFEQELISISHAAEEHFVKGMYGELNAAGHEEESSDACDV